MFALNPNRTLVTPGRPVVETGKGLTKQSSKKETDINLIMAKYQKTGLASFVTNRQAEFMDVSDVDFQQAMDIIIRSNAMFADMPSSMRKKFNNNPEEFLNFVHDENNLDEMYELGLAIKPEDAPAPPEPAPPAEPTP